MDSMDEMQGLDGREDLLAGWITHHQDRLLRMVSMRLDPRLRARVAPSDVIQETFLEASRDIERYLREPALPVFLWLRRLTADRIHHLHRHHLGAKVRDARREMRQVRPSAGPEASSEVLAEFLVSDRSSPSRLAIRAERRSAVRRAIERLRPADREILTLRYFERLSSAEAARVLGIQEGAARKRYLRALKRFEEAVLGHRRLGRNPS